MVRDARSSEYRINHHSKTHLYSSEQSSFLFDVECMAKKSPLHLLNICIELYGIGILIVLYVSVYGVSTCVLVDLVFFWFFEVTRLKSATRCFLFGHCFPSMCCLIAGNLTAGGTTYSFKIIATPGRNLIILYIYIYIFKRNILIYNQQQHFRRLFIFIGVGSFFL